MRMGKLSSSTEIEPLAEDRNLFQDTTTSHRHRTIDIIKGTPTREDLRHRESPTQRIREDSQH